MKHQNEWEGFEALNENEENPSKYLTIAFKQPTKSSRQSAHKGKKHSKKTRIGIPTLNLISPQKYTSSVSQHNSKHQKQKQKIDKMRTAKVQQKMQTKQLKKIRYMPIPIIYENHSNQYRGKIIYRGLIPRTSDNYFRLLKDVNWELPLEQKRLQGVSLNLAIWAMFVRYFWKYLRISSKQYDIYMRVDTNTNGHMQWFYFSIKNTKITKIRLNVFRFKKRYSLYQRGFRPFVKSRKCGKDWLPGGQNVKYLRQCLPNQNGVKTVTKYYYLTFTYTFQHENDQVFFAACIPYTTTYLNKRIAQFQEAFTTNQRIKFQVKNLCTTLCGQQIQYLSIQPFRQNTQNKKKSFIVINGRSHPGETSSSWVIDGFLQNLSRNFQIQQWMCNMNICFKVVPMLNKDGVFMGNYRTGIVGDDFNRNFATGTREFFPQINAMKKLIAKCKKLGHVKLFLDLHGHSILKNSFIFGPNKQSFQKCKLIHLGDCLYQNSKYFSQDSSYYRNQRHKLQTARVYFQFEEEILSLTCQNSLGLYTQNYQTFQQTTQDWKNFGSDILLAIKQCYQQFQRFHELDLMKKKRSQDFSTNNISKQILQLQKKKKDSKLLSQKQIVKDQKQNELKKSLRMSSQAHKSTQIRHKETIKEVEPLDLYKIRPKQSLEKKAFQNQLQKSIVLSRYRQSQSQAISRYQKKSQTIRKQSSQNIYQLGIQQQIPQNFSEEYESMNDSDSETDDISLQKRQQVFKYIQQLNHGLINQNSLQQIILRDQLSPAKGFREYKLNFESINVSAYDKKPANKLKPLKFQQYRLKGMKEKNIKGNLDMFFINQTMLSSNRQRERINRRKNQILNRKYKETKREELMNEIFPKKEEKEYLLMRIKEMTLQKGNSLKND